MFKSLRNIKVDKKNDALYFRVDENAIVESEEIKPGVILDYDKDDNVVGLELFGINAIIPEKELSSIQFQTS